MKLSKKKFYPPSQKTTGVNPWMNAKFFPLRRDFAPDEARGEETPGVSPWELYHHKILFSFGRQKGVSLIELLLVISLIVIVGASSYSYGSASISRNNLRNKTNEIISSLRSAQINSISGKNGSVWGVSVGNGKIVMFMGPIYSEPGTDFDVEYSIPSTIQVTPAEVVFGKLEGNPSQPVTITVSNNLGESNIIVVNEVGIVDVN